MFGSLLVWYEVVLDQGHFDRKNLTNSQIDLRNSTALQPPDSLVTQRLIRILGMAGRCARTKAGLGSGLDHRIV
jgi:hypothetical protein